MKYDVGDWIFMLTCSEVNPKWERIICFHQFASFAACTGHDTVWQHVSYPNRHFTSVAGTCTCTSCIGYALCLFFVNLIVFFFGGPTFLITESMAIYFCNPVLIIIEMPMADFEINHLT